MSLSLRALQHFSVLVEERHFSRAAARLHLTQSALSRSIQSLEKSLGLELLDRNPGRLQLTQSGQMVLERAQRILTETSALERESELVRGLDTGHVAFGIGVFPAAGLLSPLLERLARDHPGFSVHVEIESWQRLHKKLESDQLDFVVAVTHSLPPSSEFAVRPLPAQHGGLFVRAGHPLLTVARRVLRSALEKYCLATTDLPPRARSHLARLYRITGNEQLPIALECDSIEALRGVALASDTVLFSTREAINSDLASGRLVQLPLSYSPSDELACGVIHPARRTLPPAAEKVIAIVEELMMKGPGVTAAPE